MSVAGSEDFQDAHGDEEDGNDSNNNNLLGSSPDSASSGGSSEQYFEEESSGSSSADYVQRTDQELFASAHDDDESSILFEPEDDLLIALNMQPGTSFRAAGSTRNHTQPHEVISLFSGEMRSPSEEKQPEEGEEGAVVESSSDEFSEEVTSSTLVTPRASNRRQDRTVRLNVQESSRAGGGTGDTASTSSDMENWELRHLLNVLGLGYSSRRRLRGEGIESVADLYMIEDMLRQGKVQNLKSVETAKLVQFLDWVKAYQSKANGCLPDIERHLTTHEFEGFMESRRTRAYSHVWPFMAIDENDFETRILSLPVTYSLNIVAAMTNETDGERIGIAPAPTHASDTSGISSAIHVGGLNDSGEAGVSAFRSPTSARIRDNFIVAEESHARFQFESRTRRRLKKAMDKYRLVVDDAGVSVDDCMIQAFCCIKLAILLRRVEFKNERESHELLKRAAEQYKVPTAMFFYGYDLIIGRGSAEQNLCKGIALLDSAAAAGIGEAYFVLGNVHEGEIHGVRQDLHVAQQYYEAASNAFHRSPHRAWLGTFPDQGINPSMPWAGMVSHWEAEFSSSQGLVNAKGWCDSLLAFPTAASTVCQWIMWVSQSFLLGAAAILSRQAQTEHYSGLLPAIPVLGTVLSLLSTTQALAQLWSNRHRRAQIRNMQRVKLMALRRMLKVPLWNTVFVPPLHYLLLFHSYIAGWFYEGSPQYCRSQLEAVHARILWLEAWGHSTLSLLWYALTDALVVLLALAWLSTWLVLLVQETRSQRDDCSNWWESTCQGSMVQCNAEEQKLGNCFFLGPTATTLRSASGTSAGSTNSKESNLDVHSFATPGLTEWDGRTGHN